MTKNTEDIISNLIGCGRAKTILGALKAKKEISETEKSFLEGHCKDCTERCDEYKAVSTAVSNQ